MSYFFKAVLRVTVLPDCYTYGHGFAIHQAMRQQLDISSKSRDVVSEIKPVT